MAEHNLSLEKRELTGKKLKSLREKGLIPSVIYGGKEPVLLASEYVATEKVLGKAGYHSPIDLDVDGKKQLAIVKDVQIDPVSRRIVNIEFQAISANEAVVATTPVTIVNFEASEAAKIYHFAINQALEEIDIKAKPADLPKGLEVDAAGLKELDDKITVSDIKLPNGVEFADKELDAEQVVASLYDPAAEAAAREAAEKAAAEAEPIEAADVPSDNGNARIKYNFLNGKIVTAIKSKISVGPFARDGRASVRGILILTGNFICFEIIFYSCVSNASEFAISRSLKASWAGSAFLLSPDQA